MATRPLTATEQERLAAMTGVEGLRVTCDCDNGYGPCGTYLDWADGFCRDGHPIEIAINDAD